MDIEIKETAIISQKKVVGTQITADLYDKLKAEADEAFMSISDLLRKIIYMYYKNQNERNDY